MKTFIVDVTEGDIKAGWACDGWHCPVARAVSRALGQEVFVGPYNIIFEGSGRSIPVPEPIYGFIRSFDKGHQVEPFKFTLELPDA